MNWFKTKKIDDTPKIKDFPVKIEIWPAGNSFDKKDAEKICPLFPYWDKDGNYIKHTIGEYVPTFKVGWHTAIYKIINWKVQGNDHAGFDDGRWYELEFVELCRYDVEERLMSLEPNNPQK